MRSAIDTTSTCSNGERQGQAGRSRAVRCIWSQPAGRGAAAWKREMAVGGRLVSGRRCDRQARHKVSAAGDADSRQQALGAARSFRYGRPWMADGATTECGVG